MDFDLDRTRRLIHQQSDGLADRLDQLSEADWPRPTPCPEWTVADIVAHLSSGAQVQLRSLQRGLQGDNSPLFKDMSEREALTKAKLLLPVAARAADYRDEAAALLGFIDTLLPADMEKTAWHQSGVHPLSWFMVQRLGETTMHRGDIQEALGDEFEYPPDVAEVLLPDYIARLPRLFQPQTAGGVRALIAFGRSGAVRIRAGAAEFVPDAGEYQTLTLRADPPGMLRIVTGRLHPKDALASGRLYASGDVALLDRWRELFRTL
jgi:uncharacterized protein (TIGR03083 family)